MEQLQQLLVIQTGADVDFYNRFSHVLDDRFPVSVIDPNSFQPQPSPAPELVVYSTRSVTKEDIAAVSSLCRQWPQSWVVVVAAKLNDALTGQVVEAGAADFVCEHEFDAAYLQKQVLLARRYYELHSRVHAVTEQLEACIENTPGVAIQWLRSSGEVVFWNRHSEALYEWTATEALGKTLDQLMLSPKAAAIFRQHANVVTTGMRQTVLEEFVYQTRRGKQGYCRSTIFSVPDKGNDVFVVCMDVDITDVVHLKHQLKSSEGKYQFLIELQADAIAIFDRTGRLLETNSGASRLLQYSREEFKHINLQQILWLPELASIPLDLHVLDKGENTIKQRRMRRRDGTVVETEVHTTAIDDGVYLASVRDLTQRLAVQHQLEKEIELSDSIINSLPGLFYLFQKGVGYLRWNKLFETITGYSASELRYLQPADFFSDEEKPLIEEAIRIVFEKGEHAVEAHLYTKDGRSIPYYFTGRAIQYDGAPAFLGTGIDLTPLRKLEEALANEKIRAQKRLMQAMIAAGEQEKAKLGRELHDNVNQILSVVRMYLAVLESGEEAPGISLPKTRALVSTAMEEIRNLSHRLAASYHFETGLAPALVDMLQPLAAAAGITLTTALSPYLDSRTHAEQKLALYRIVQEGISNIVKYAKAKTLHLSITIIHDELRLILKDDGTGFDKKATRKGLGLSNIINRAEALGGGAHIQSAPGKGTQLEVWFPVQAVSS